MAAAKLKLLIEQGATFIKVLTWKTGSPAMPVDVTGYTAHMQIRSSVDTEEVLADLSTENGGIVMGGDTGSITLTIPATQTAGFTWNGGVYDLEITSPDGIVRRLVYGTVTVSKEITR